MNRRLVYDGVEHDIEPHETVLEALERHGRGVPSACRAGTCHSCLLQALDGDPGERARRGLKDTLRAAGYFLACQCHPAGDITAGPPGGELSAPARIASIGWLGHRTLDVRLTVEGEFSYSAGQFVTLLRPDLLARSYSLASLPADGELRLHVRHHPGGAMSGWLADRAAPGDPVTVRGPYGTCFYVPGWPEQPLLLAGTGTGLAPLYGILRDALRHGHSGPIRLVHGALDARGLYLVSELSELARAVPTLDYQRCVLAADTDADAASGPSPKPSPESSSGPGPGGEVRVGDLVDVVTRLVPDPTGHRVFLCGDPDVTRTLQRRLFMNGASNRDIHVDAFTPPASTTPTVPPGTPQATR
ncbi:MAG TPA: 2Fe-2S iron-sulfur cluster-binding protein [Mycobacteriales bacterium]|nr:2Fe-2S iron-sulfur cluster-binding protein [Mycobacteriales bacterium]